MASTIFTADHVAAAIVAAAREMGADPISVASRETEKPSHKHANYPISRTRSYAAIVLRDVFPTVSTAAIGRAVGQPNHPEIWASQLFSGRKKGLRWWDEEIYRRVRRAVQSAVAKEPPAEPVDVIRELGPVPTVDLPPFVPPRPAASERQRKAAQMLEEAMRNTAAMSRHSQ